MLKPSSQSERSGQEGYQPMPAELGWTRGPSKASYFSSTGIADANVVTISLSAAGSRSTQQIFGGLGAPRARTAAGRRLSSPQAAAVEHLTLLPSGISYFLTLRLLYLMFPALKIARAGSPGRGEEVTRGVDLLCELLIPLPCPSPVRVQLNWRPHHPLLSGLGSKDTASIFY